MSAARSLRVLPGFGLSLGYTVAYLSLIVLIPLAAVFLKAGSLGFEHFWQAATSPRVLASYRLSFGASLIAEQGRVGVLQDVLFRKEGRQQRAQGRSRHGQGLQAVEAGVEALDPVKEHRQP